MPCKTVSIDNLKELGFKGQRQNLIRKSTPLTGTLTGFLVDWNCEDINRKREKLIAEYLSESNPDAVFNIKSITKANLSKLQSKNPNVFIPLFPQFSLQTTAKALKDVRTSGKIRISPPFCQSPGFLGETLKNLLSELNSLSNEEIRTTKPIFIFRNFSKGSKYKPDPYREQSQKSAEELMNLFERSTGSSLPFSFIYCSKNPGYFERKKITDSMATYKNQGFNKILAIHWYSVTSSSTALLDFQLQRCSKSAGILNFKSLTSLDTQEGFIDFLGETFVNEFKKLM